MTKKFDERARQELAMVYKPRDFSGVRISSLEVRPIPAKYARPYIATFHYSRTMPDSTRFSFGLFHDDRIVGVCTFGMGCGKNQYTSVIPDIQNGQYIELTRLWLEDTIGRNGESYFISRCIRMLPREIRLVISFSDEKQGHVGTIYQAANFAYLGKNGGGRMLMGQDGIEKHPRLLGIYRMRHPEYKDYTNAQLMELLGYRYIQGGAKHKYAMGRDKFTRRIIEKSALPYPKAEYNAS